MTRYQHDDSDPPSRFIPTAAMVKDPRLHRLFSAAGKALLVSESDDSNPFMDDLEEALLDVAPEYLPPGNDDEKLWVEWQKLVGDWRDG